MKEQWTTSQETAHLAAGQNTEKGTIDSPYTLWLLRREEKTFQPPPELRRFPVTWREELEILACIRNREDIAFRTNDDLTKVVWKCMLQLVRRASAAGDSGHLNVDRLNYAIWHGDTLADAVLELREGGTLPDIRSIEASPQTVGAFWHGLANADREVPCLPDVGDTYRIELKTLLDRCESLADVVNDLGRVFPVKKEDSAVGRVFAETIIKQREKKALRKAGLEE